jgi:hypothetical protein|tara:strand:+ start:531 stop:713 length:183 start_codon:yes stop_codon:yes gene_type:complete
MAARIQAPFGKKKIKLPKSQHTPAVVMAVRVQTSKTEELGAVGAEDVVSKLTDLLKQTMI